MATEKAVVDVLVRALDLEPKNVATLENLDRLEACIGASLPTLFREWMLRLGTTNSASLEFDEEPVLFSRIEKMIKETVALDLEGKGVVAFGRDFFGSIWILKTSSSAPNEGGAILLAPVQERYTDPENPVEHKADSFRQFLQGLTNSADDDEASDGAV